MPIEEEEEEEEEEEILHVSGIFSAHHQEFSTVHSALVSFMQVLMIASKQSQDETAVPS